MAITSPGWQPEKLPECGKIVMKHHLRLLNETERTMLEIQFHNTPDPMESFSASGAHYILTDILNRLGYHPTSRQDAYQLALALLSYTGDDHDDRDDHYANLADQT
jgi:hypothetical protein